MIYMQATLEYLELNHRDTLVKLIDSGTLLKTKSEILYLIIN
jgi:hypothetical protein